MSERRFRGTSAPKPRPRFSHYQLLVMAAVILAWFVMAAFRDGTLVNAVAFGKCEVRLLPPSCGPGPDEADPY